MPAAALLLITYLGTASFILDIGGMRILTDPGDFFTARFTAAKARDVRDIDLVLITHGDFDHVNRLTHVPGSEHIIVLAPETVKNRMPSHNVSTDAEYIRGDVRVGLSVRYTAYSTTRNTGGI